VPIVLTIEDHLGNGWRFCHEDVPFGSAARCRLNFQIEPALFQELAAGTHLDRLAG